MECIWDAGNVCGLIYREIYFLLFYVHTVIAYVLKDSVLPMIRSKPKDRGCANIEIVRVLKDHVITLITKVLEARGANLREELYVS